MPPAATLSTWVQIMVVLTSLWPSSAVVPSICAKRLATSSLVNTVGMRLVVRES